MEESYSARPLKKARNANFNFSSVVFWFESIRVERKAIGILAKEGGNKRKIKNKIQLYDSARIVYSNCAEIS
jgi:hypothetical protein